MYDINFFFLNLVVSGKRYIAANEIRIKLSPCWSCIAHPFFSVMLLKDIRFFICPIALRKVKGHILKALFQALDSNALVEKSEWLVIWKILQ